MTTFEAYVERRGRALWRTAWLLTGDAQRAEDLVQSALAKVWPRWSRIDDPDAYLRRTMVTSAVDGSRRRWTGETPTEVLPEPPGGGTAVDVELRTDVLRALATLPPRQRAVIVLRFYDDLTEAATAAALGVAVGTVKSQTARAMATLRTSGLLSRPGTEDA